MTGGFWRLVLVSFVPLRAQVLPLGIHGDDQRNLLDSKPALDSFLAFDGVAYIVKAFEIRQTVKLVLCCETGAALEFVLTHSADEAVCDPGVKRFRAVRHDVDEVRFLRARWHGSHDFRMARPGGARL